MRTQKAVVEAFPPFRISSNIAPMSGARCLKCPDCGRWTDHLKLLRPLTLCAVQVKVPTSPASSDAGPARVTRLAGSGEGDILVCLLSKDL